MDKGIQFANREVCNVIFADYKTKKAVHYMDYANATTQEITGEQVFARGGQGYVPRVTFYGEKGGNIQIETQMLTSQIFSLMTGASIETNASFIKRLELSAAEGALTIPEGVTFIDGTVEVYAAGDDCGTAVEVTVEGQVITLPVGADDDYVVYGMESITTGVQKMSIKSTTFPKAVIIYAETVMKGSDDVLYPYKLTAYKASPQQNFSLGMSSSGDPATVTLTFDLLADDDDNIMDMILIEENAADEITLTSIAITTPPTDIVYDEGDTFDPTGMVVTATYSDGSTAAVTGYTFSPSTALASTDTSVTVFYTEDGVVRTVSQPITVS